MIHKHLLTALHAGLTFYLQAANEAVTIGALDSISVDVDELRAKLAKIRAKPPSLRVYAKAGTATPPLIVTQQTSRRVQNRPLGHSVNGVESTISRQEAKIELIAKTSEECEVLADLVRAAISQARVDFLNNGYLHLELNGLEELGPHEQLTAEELGVFVRRLTLSALIQEDVARILSSSDLGPLTLGLSPDGRVNVI